MFRAQLTNLLHYTADDDDGEIDNVWTFVWNHAKIFYFYGFKY